LTAENLNRSRFSGRQPWDTSSSHRQRVSQTDDYWRDVGVGEEDMGMGQDCIVDPDGSGPRIWFQVVPVKAVKNRLHQDISVRGGRAFPIEMRRQRVDAEAERLAALGASYVRVLSEEGLDHYGIAMQDPEGNEFDIN